MEDMAAGCLMDLWVKRYGVVLVIVIMLACSYFVAVQKKEPSPKEILLGMTVEQKVGQIMVGYFQGKKLTPEMAERIRKLHLGGVILYSRGAGDNIENPQQVAALVKEIQQTAKIAGEPALFITIDQEGGTVNRLTEGVTRFPSNMSFGAIGNGDYVHREAEVIGRELRAIGINVNFAPVVDVNTNPYNPIIGTRSYSSSSYQVSRLAVNAIDGYRQAGVICVAKHFPGHGDTTVDSHVGLPTVNKSLPELERDELYPFREMIANGVPAIMAGHIVMPALDTEKRPATLSPPALIRLRQEWKFDGLVFTDALNMGALQSQCSVEEASIRSFLAGSDVLLFGNDDRIRPEEQEKIFKALVEAVKSGRISRERLDKSVLKILTAKADYGILDNPLPQPEDLAHWNDSAFSLQIAKESLTLIKDDKQLLPLKAGAGNIPVILPLEYQHGYSMLLKQSGLLQPVYVKKRAGQDDIERVQLAAKDAKVVVVGAYGLLRNPSWVALIRAIGPARVVLVSLDTPYDIMSVPEVSTCIADYGDAPMNQQAIAEYLLGRFKAEGHLPVDLPQLYHRGWGIYQ